MYELSPEDIKIIRRRAEHLCFYYNVGQDGKDLVQNVMAEAVRAARKYDPNKGAVFSTYFNKRINGIFIERIRRIKGRRFAYPEFFSRGNFNNFEDVRNPTERSIEDVDADDFLENASRDFSERDRKIVSLLVGGAKQKEIAKEIGVSRGMVSQLVSKIRKRLWEYYAPERYAA